MNEVSQITQFFIGLGLLFFVYHYMYKRTRLDQLREDIFTMRDELFDYMWQHNVSYQLPAYQLMRNLLNGLIRFADKLSLPAVFLLAYFSHPSRQTPALHAAIEEIPDPEVRNHFIKVNSRVFHRIVTHLLLEGPLWLVFKPAQLAIWLYQRFRKPSAAGDPDESYSARRLDSLAKRPKVVAMADEFVVLGRPESLEARLLYQYGLSSHTAGAR